MNIITGMHRSGTSGVARLFYEHGADMGSRETFYRPDKWNPGGYFEQPDIHAVNIPLINGPWGKLAYLNLPSEKTILKRADRIKSKIAAIAAKYTGKIVKETRFCLTLNAWQTHGANISKVLICLREPIETARSINKRNRIPVNFALKLWHDHYVRLLRQITEMPVWFIHYNHLLDESLQAKEMMTAFHFMGFSLAEEDAKRLWRSAIKKEMNHQRTVPPAYPADVDDLWRKLTERHRIQQPATTEFVPHATRS